MIDLLYVFVLIADATQHAQEVKILECSVKLPAFVVIDLSVVSISDASAADKNLRIIYYQYPTRVCKQPFSFVIDLLYVFLLTYDVPTIMYKGNEDVRVVGRLRTTCFSDGFLHCG